MLPDVALDGAVAQVRRSEAGADIRSRVNPPPSAVVWNAKLPQTSFPATTWL
jgi:hypothetical protein